MMIDFLSSFIIYHSSIIDLWHLIGLKEKPKTLPLLQRTKKMFQKDFGTKRLLEKLLKLKQPPTAVLTINDYVALDAIQFARKSKLKINKDISFVSYANLPITNYLEFPPLASVEQFPYQQAKKAAEILFSSIQKPKSEEPLVYQNRTYLPAAYIAQLLGASTSFDSANKISAVTTKNMVIIENKSGKPSILSAVT